MLCLRVTLGLSLRGVTDACMAGINILLIDLAMVPTSLICRLVVLITLCRAVVWINRDGERQQAIPVCCCNIMPQTG